MGRSKWFKIRHIERMMAYLLAMQVIHSLVMSVKPMKLGDSLSAIPGCGRSSALVEK
jgi:hypothetical protein